MWPVVFGHANTRTYDPARAVRTQCHLRKKTKEMEDGEGRERKGAESGWKVRK